MTRATQDPLLRELADAPRCDLRVLVVVAHPDDEALGFGGLLPRLREVQVLTLTDGAPLDPARPDPEDPARLAHAARRAAELDRALDLAGVPPSRRHRAGCIDQRAMDALPALVDAVSDLLRRLRPDVVLTHPWEGGHPDHDAAAFVVAAAVARTPGPAVVEGAFYHGIGGAFVPQAFLPGDTGVVDLAPDPAVKGALLACHASQADALAPFSAAVERLRRAPAYDFLAPPHEGVLHYARAGWADFGRVRARVEAAIRDLGLGRPPWR